MIAQRFRTQMSDHTTCKLACYVITQCRELVECFFLSFTQERKQ